MSVPIKDEANNDKGGLMESYIFGCELSSKNSCYTFLGEEDGCEHNLSLCTISLGDGAKDEYNVVEVTGNNYNNEKISVPIATLKLSCQTMVNLENYVVQSPATFHLKSGSGPVYVSGQVIVVPLDWDSENDSEGDTDFEESDDDSAYEDEDLDPIVPAKKKQRT